MFLNFCFLLALVVSGSLDPRKIFLEDGVPPIRTLESFLHSPTIFIPGFRIEGIACKFSESHKPFHPRLILMDMNDLYSYEPNIAVLCDVIPKYFQRKVPGLNDIQIALYLFQLDSVIDFLLLRSLGKPSLSVQHLLLARKQAVELLRRSYSYRTAVLDLVTICPSYRIQKFLMQNKAYLEYGIYRFDDVSPMICLSQADGLSQLAAIDPFEAFNLRTLLIGLLSSRLEDLSVPEYQKQQWFSRFVDHNFWMSSMKIAMILVSAMRAEYFGELVVLRHVFTLEEWRSAGFFLSPKEVTALPRLFRALVSRKTVHVHSRILADALLSHFKTQSSGQLAKSTRVFVGGEINQTAMNFLIHPFASANSILDVLQDPKSILDFSVAIAILLVNPEVASQFREKFMHVTVFATAKSPVLEVFAGPSFLALNTSAEFPVKQVFKTDKSKHDQSPGQLVEMLASLSLSLIKNFVPVVRATLASESHCVIASKAGFNEHFGLSPLDGLVLYTKMCHAVLSYDVVKEDLAQDLQTLGFFEVMKTANIPDFLQSILIEAIISMYLTRNQPLPKSFVEFKIERKFAFSKTLSKLRRVRRIMSGVDLLALLQVYTQPVKQEPAVYWITIWAILPRLLEGDGGAREVSTFLNSLAVPHYAKIDILRETILTLLLEHVSFGTFKVLLEEFLQYFFCKSMNIYFISSRKRADWLSSEEITQLANLSNKNCMPYLRFAIFFSFKVEIPSVEPTEYPQAYFAGELPFHQKSIGRSIVSAISRMILDQETHILPRSFLEAIFLDTGHKYIPEARERIRFEIENYMYLSLLSKEFSMHVVNALSLVGEDQEEKEELLLKDIEKLYNVTDFPPASQSNVSEEESSASSPSKPPAPSTSRPMRNRAQAPKSGLNRPTKKQLSVKQKPKEVQSEEQPKQKGLINQGELKLEYGALFLTEVKEKTSGKEICIVKEKAEEEPEERKTLTRLTLRRLRKNSVILSNGHVRPKDSPSDLFQIFVYEKLREGGGFPFNLDPRFIAYVTKGEYKEEFANSQWKPIRGWTEQETWKPKVYHPIKVFGKRLGLVQIHSLKKYVLALPETILARLQSLVFYSNHTSESLLSVSGPYTAKYQSSRRTLKFEIVETVQEYRVENGWIHIPAFPADQAEFIRAVEMLTLSFLEKSKKKTVLANTTRKTARPQKKAEERRVQSNTTIDTSTCNNQGGRITPEKSPENKSEDKTKSEGEKIEEKDKSEDKSKISVEINTELVKSEKVVKSEKLAFEEGESGKAEVKTLKSSFEGSSANWQLKASSSEFVPQNRRLNSKYPQASFYVSNFAQIVNIVTPQNAKAKYIEFRTFLESGIEYIALDCEMTGIYTKADELVHKGNPDLKKVNNTSKLIAGAHEHQMFQLGLTVKSTRGYFSIWSFFTATPLTEESFTPDTFDFLFIKPRKKTDPEMLEEEKRARALDEIKKIASNYIDVRPFLSLILGSHVPLVLFSGYIDLMHVFKASDMPFGVVHEEMQSRVDFLFYDVKYIASMEFRALFALEELVRKLFKELFVDTQRLHDASYDSLLTALTFEQLQIRSGRRRINNLAQVLFKFN